MLRQFLDREFVRFVITGVGAAGLLACLTFAALHSPLPPFLGALLAYGITVLTAYTVQHRWTFGGRHAHAQSFPRYCTAQVLCAAVTAGLAQLLAHAGAAPGPTSLAVTFVASAMSYVLSRYWVFSDRRA